MIRPFMRKVEQSAARRRNIINHINLLEARYPEQMRKEAISHLRSRLVSLEMQERLEELGCLATKHQRN
jgi:hypothetical protein